jgi:hypothetical protein
MPVTHEVIEKKDHLLNFAKKIPIETNAFERQAKRFLSIAAFLFMAVSFFMLHKAAEAAPTLPPTIISYQGKVLSSSNTPISTAFPRMTTLPRPVRYAWRMLSLL